MIVIKFAVFCVMTKLVASQALAGLGTQDDDEGGLWFGESFHQKNVDVHEGFPSALVFFRDYVASNRPLFMKGATVDSAAYRSWTDEYLLKKTAKNDEPVRIEKGKKETRPQLATKMRFSEFMASYKEKDVLMVDDTPAVLRPDVPVPCCIQCDGLNLSEDTMRISDGEIATVIHAEFADSIHCVVRGRRDFIMVDPQYAHLVDFVPSDAYSLADVDDIDYDTYPGLLDIPFYYNVSVSAGDCLFLPYRWIHHVRSHLNNVAVSFVWEHYDYKDTEAAVCREKCDARSTLDSVRVVKKRDRPFHPRLLYDLFGLIIKAVDRGVTRDGFVKSAIKCEFLIPIIASVGRPEMKKRVRELFDALDEDKNEKVTGYEYRSSSGGDMWIVAAASKSKEAKKRIIEDEKVDKKSSKDEL